MVLGRDYHKEYSRNYYHKRKAEYIELLGGKCAVCSGVDGLQFDHIDPNSKSFAIGKLLNFAKSKVIDELNKCQLLCEKCHIEKTKINKDGYSKRAKGSQIATSKLTEEVVSEIKVRLNTESVGQVAKELGLHSATINFIKAGKTWKHVV